MCYVIFLVPQSVFPLVFTLRLMAKWRGHGGCTMVCVHEQPPHRPGAPSSPGLNMRIIRDQYSQRYVSFKSILGLQITLLFPQYKCTFFAALRFGVRPPHPATLCRPQPVHRWPPPDPFSRIQSRSENVAFSQKYPTKNPESSPLVTSDHIKWNR